MRRAGGLLLFLLLPALPAGAAGTGAAFLKIPPTASSAVFPYPPLVEDGSSMTLNPGALSRRPRQMLSATYSPYLEDSQLSYVAFTQPLEEGVLGASFLRLAVNGIEGRAADRTKTGDFRASDDAFGLAYAHSGFGLHLKYVRQKIDAYSAGGAAADLGWDGSAGERRPVKFGAALRNLGPRMKFLDDHFSLPASLSVYAAAPVSEGFVLQAGVLRELTESRMSCSLALQYPHRERFYARTGYTLVSGRSLSEMPLPSAGFGVFIGKHSLDYAFTPFRDLGTVHRLSLAFRF
jgi:hypothetical protein